MSIYDANELLMSGGIKAAKFETLGATVVGTIVEPPKAQQMTKYGTNEPDFWPSGDPKMQIVVTIQTDLRDDEKDDGKRRLYITPRMMPPVRDAVRRAGAPGLEVGGRITVKWVSGTGQGQGNPKVYAAEYSRPALDPDSLLNSNQQAGGAQAAPVVSTSPGQPVTHQQTAPQAQASPTMQPPTPAAQTPEAPPGVDPAVWATMPDQQRQAVLAAMSASTNTGQQFPF